MPFELSFEGPSTGNPFVEVEFTATFRSPDGAAVDVGGFYDGHGRYFLRLLPGVAGAWSYTTSSNEPLLDQLSGGFDIAVADAQGPVRVEGFHFRYADGGRYVPVGTTAYAWTHQGEALENTTLSSLSGSPFNKIRMCIFPKSYLYNSNEPELFPFERDESGGWDTSRFDSDFWNHLEQRIAELGRLGVQGDLILFHPYDRWGFSSLGPEADDRYVRYLTRRLAAFPNVWWSMANEFDLAGSKSEADWERLAQLVVEEDHADHLISIHNGARFYDYSMPWITHCSIQRIDLYRTAENTDAWRQEWGKPVVMDECGYEGDLDQAWGNITGEELTRRSWEGAVRGGYVGHGETYFSTDEVIWWSKGGELKGTSPARIAFLQSIVAGSPSGVLDPLPSDWDAPWGGVADTYIVIYLGINRPRFRSVSLPHGLAWRVDIIDTWNMTVERLDGTHEGTITVPLPARQYMAIRLTVANEEQSA